jgi:seryl-tRNA synthetase
MLDLRWIAENKDLVKDGARRKRFDVDVDKLCALYEERKKVQQQVEQIAAEKNRFGKEIGKLPPDQKQAGLARMKELTAGEGALRKRLGELDPDIERLHLLVPSPPSPDVPDGKDESENVELRKWGEIPKFDFKPKTHMELGESLDLVDKDRAARLAGTRTYFLKGDGALLELAVLKFALDYMVYQRGFTAVLPPVLVNDEAMRGTGYFPGGEAQAYRFPKDEDDAGKTDAGFMNLVGTAEVPLTAYYAGEILEDAQLPVYFAGWSPCFRREAGAAGKDTAGLYRIHQFDKIEQVVICRADEAESIKEHHHILSNSEAILQALKLPYRVVNVCTGDLGRGQVQKFDVETWMPSRNSYGETHSASRFHDFQARRLNLRYRDKDGRVRVCHTLNNTVIAGPRILIPILELYQNADGTVTIPEVLRPYMGGRERIEPKTRR